MSESPRHGDRRVRHFRQVLLWPLQLMPIREGSQVQRHWEVLERGGDAHPWREVVDEFTGDPAKFQERHYGEFVTFLPYVQRFLYGDARAAGREARSEAAASPMRVFRRADVAAVRMTPRRGDAPLTLAIAHVDLYFFYDIDVVMLNVEVRGDDLALSDAEDALYRFGRAYPAGWDAQGDPLHCMHAVEWLDRDGRVLAASDATERDRFLAFVCEHRAPLVAAHWTYLLRPLVLDHADETGAIRYRQIEYYRMPVMAFVAVEDPRGLARGDFVRLGLVTPPGADDALPYSARHVADFEQRYCLDRFWDPGAAAAALTTRYMSCGHGLVVVGDAASPYFLDGDKGVLAQFRHQHFLLFLIAHFQKAALLMFAERLVTALMALEVGDPESVKRFKRTIRQSFEIFLRFTHRYWFHDVADQAQAKALFQLTAGHLGLDRLYTDVKERIYDMAQYLDSDSLRRQANTVVRLTVVTTFGMIGTIATGYFGMNLLVADLVGDDAYGWKLAYFAAIVAATMLLLVLTVARAKRLSDFLDVLSDERQPWRAKLGAFWRVWSDGEPLRSDRPAGTATSL